MFAVKWSTHRHKTTTTATTKGEKRKRAGKRETKQIAYRQLTDQ